MNAPVRRFTVEHRNLAITGRRLKPTSDSVQALKVIAGDMRNMPRECAVDRAELLLWLSRMARQLDAIALDGFEPSPRAVAAHAHRQPLMPRPAVDPRVIAESVFGSTAAPRRANQTTTVQVRKGRTVQVERRRRAAAGAGQIPLFADEELRR